MPRQPKKAPLPGAQRLLYWLSQAAQDAREQADVGVGLISDLYGVSGRQIERFERGENFPGDPDRLVAAYAHAIGLDDARVIYRQAIENWFAKGEAPQLDGQPVRRATQFQREIEKPARSRQSRASERKPTSTPKRREAQ